MVIGMATTKVTVTLDEEDVRKIRELVGKRKASSVSGFVQHAVGVALQDVAGWGALLAGALAETGGPITTRERKWADRILSSGRGRRGKRSRHAA
jgi:Arc/MetJ-type ribon-helix-helix transcriptional regulator